MLYFLLFLSFQHCVLNLIHCYLVIETLISLTQLSLLIEDYYTDSHDIDLYFFNCPYTNVAKTKVTHGQARNSLNTHCLPS